jgi:hypothetical protein
LDNRSAAVHSLNHTAHDPNHKPRYCLFKYYYTLKKVGVGYLGSLSKVGGALEHGDEQRLDINRYRSVV